MVIIMITGDFLGMSLTTDNVRPSPTPNAWRIGRLTTSGVIMGLCLLAFCTGVLAVGRFRDESRNRERWRTLAFVVLVFGSQATLYAIRQRRHLWGSSPSLSGCGVVRRRYRDRFDAGRGRNCNDTLAGLGGGRHTCRSGGVRIRLGFGEGSGIRSSRDRQEPSFGRIARRRTVSIGWDGESERLPVGLCPLANTGRRRRPCRSGFRRGRGWLYWSTYRTATVHYATQKIELGSNRPRRDRKRSVVPTATAAIGARVSA